MSISTTSKPIDSTDVIRSSTADSKLAATLAIILGSFFIFMIGFSHIGVVHNAAHDTRHSSAFPCH